MWRIQGLINSFKASTGMAADRNVGELVRITNDGEADDATGQDDKLYLPLTEKFVVGEEVVAAQVTGVAKVYVETASSIVAGSAVGIGATGKGIAIATSGDFVLGQALATPAGDGDFIPVLLAPQAPGTGIY